MYWHVIWLVDLFAGLYRGVISSQRGRSIHLIFKIRPVYLFVLITASLLEADQLAYHLPQLLITHIVCHFIFFLFLAQYLSVRSLHMLLLLTLLYI